MFPAGWSKRPLGRARKKRSALPVTEGRDVRHYDRKAGAEQARMERGRPETPSMVPLLLLYSSSSPGRIFPSGAQGSPTAAGQWQGAFSGRGRRTARTWQPRGCAARPGRRRERPPASAPGERTRGEGPFARAAQYAIRPWKRSPATRVPLIIAVGFMPRAAFGCVHGSVPGARREARPYRPFPRTEPERPAMDSA